MAIPTAQEGSKLLIYLDDISKEITLSATGSLDTYAIQNEVVFKDIPLGFHIVKLQLKSLQDSSESIGRLNNLHLTGAAAKNSENVMRRYRANAVHCKWETDSI